MKFPLRILHLEDDLTEAERVPAGPGKPGSKLCHQAYPIDAKKGVRDAGFEPATSCV
jgi:hypothetical protein